jgi:predicted house-cleaning noncanonical NTP pyrophosphatase (MazG superfamily)
MAKRIVDKLVRDKILPQMQEQGKNVVFRKLTDPKEQKAKMAEKLGEKYKELFEAMMRSGDGDEAMENSIADMLEVLNKVAGVWKIKLTKIMEKKKQKIEDKGWYNDMMYIQYIEE